MLQWLRLFASNSGVMGSVPGQGIRIPRATQLIIIIIIIIIIIGQTDLMCPLICGTEKDLCSIYIVLCSIYVVLPPKI